MRNPRTRRRHRDEPARDLSRRRAFAVRRECVRASRSFRVRSVPVSDRRQGHGRAGIAQQLRAERSQPRRRRHFGRRFPQPGYVSHGVRADLRLHGPRRGRRLPESRASQRRVVSICGLKVSRARQPVRARRVAGRFGLVRRAGMASDAAIRRQPARARAETNHRERFPEVRNRISIRFSKRAFSSGPTRTRDSSSATRPASTTTTCARFHPASSSTARSA